MTIFQAFGNRLHPLGQLLQSLVDAFRATYGGVVAHSRLLPYAVQEVRVGGIVIERKNRVMKFVLVGNRKRMGRKEGFYIFLSS